MHEISLVRNLIPQAVAAAAPLPAGTIRCIRVSAGPLTGVEPWLLARAFDSLRGEWGMPDCRLEVLEQSLRGVCRQCAHEFEIVNFVFHCPQCQSGLVHVTQGEEFRLVSLDVDQLDES